MSFLCYRGKEGEKKEIKYVVIWYEWVWVKNLTE
jgi:hypothetical protein